MFDDNKADEDECENIWKVELENLYLLDCVVTCDCHQVEQFSGYRYIKKVEKNCYPHIILNVRRSNQTYEFKAAAVAQQQTFVQVFGSANICAGVCSANICEHTLW